jgi:hypothetical protein
MVFVYMNGSLVMYDEMFCAYKYNTQFILNISKNEIESCTS